MDRWFESSFPIQERCAMNALEVCRAFDDAGYEIFLVGGCVRDHLMGKAPKDLDLTTNARPDRILEILSRFGNPYRVGEKFGTIGLGNIEITTYRSEAYTAGSRKPEVTFGDDLVRDLSRRDFTINAIAQNPLTLDYIDPFDGRHDIWARTIRAVGTPSDRFREDPLRILRAIRFESVFGFMIDGRTWSELFNSVEALRTISAERIAEEYNKILLGPHPQSGLYRLWTSGAMRCTVPELLLLRDHRIQGRFHHMSLWDHTMNVVSGVPAKLELRWAALLHDIGKPDTRTEENGEVHYYGHEVVGSRIARNILRDLRYSNDFVQYVTSLVRNHMAVNMYKRYWTNGAVRRLVIRLGDTFDDAVQLSHYDQEAHLINHRDDVFDFVRRSRELAQERPNGLAEIPLNGHDLMDIFDLQPGPILGQIKEYLTNLVLDGTIDVDDRDGAIDAVKTWLETTRP
jgi:poly(A) polymerase